MKNPAYDGFLKWLDAELNGLKQDVLTLEKQGAEEPPFSTRYRIESGALLGEIVVWEQSLTFYQAVCSLDSGEFLLERDGEPIPLPGTYERGLDEFLDFFRTNSIS